MKRVAVYAFQSLLLLCSVLYGVDNPHDSLKQGVTSALRNQLDWESNYHQALFRARQENKPLYLVFTGLDWSEPSMRFNREVLTSPAFINQFSNQFVFLRIDFPLTHVLTSEQIESNQQLKEKFKVEGFPTVVVLDKNLELIGETGNWTKGVEQYNAELEHMLASAQEIEVVLAQSKEDSLDSIDIKRLYNYAREMNRAQQANRFLEAGLKKEDNTFFLAEQYRKLVESNQRDSIVGEQIRKELLERDPNDREGLQLYVAVLDFQSLADHPSLDAQKAAEPLLVYLDRFGKDESESKWRVNMVLAQFFYAKNNQRDALEHAAKAYEKAPELIKADIHKSIEKIKNS